MAGAEEGQQQQKWEGKARAKVKQVRAEQVWPLLEDFCSFDKWLPGIDSCHHVEGIKGKPGLVRYCASDEKKKKKKEEEQEEEDMMTTSTTTKWCHEKLISIDPAVRCLSYEILDNNMGFKSYFATIKVLALPPPPPPPTTNTDDDGELELELELGCEIEWCFWADPVDGMTCEALSSYVNSSLQGIAENIEKAFAINI